MPKPTSGLPDDTKAAEGSKEPEVAEESETADKKAPKPLVRLMLMILPVLFVPAVIGGYLAFSQYGSFAQAAVSTGITFGLAQDAETETSITYGQFMTIDDMLINPKGSGGKRFLVISLGVEAKSAEILDELEQRDVVVRDAILQLLSQHTSEELASIELRDTLKRQIGDSLNSILQKGNIERLYFTQYLLQ